MRLILLIFFFFFTNRFFCQDTLTYSSLNSQQKSDWNKVYNAWLTNKFYPFLKKEKIKTNCAGCSSVYVSVVFKRYGEITANEIIKTSKCGRAFKGKQLTELQVLLNELFLPDSFERSFFSVQMGAFLKC